MSNDFVMSEEQKAKVAECRAQIAILEADKRKAEKRRLKLQKIAKNNSEPV